MSLTIKNERMAAFVVEPGKLVGSGSWAFGGSTITQLGALHAIPYLSIGANGSIETKIDESIDAACFRDLPRQTKIGAAVDSWNGNMRYVGMDRLLYWMFGWERPGTSPVTIGGGYYEHLFELDKYERNLTPYRTNEQTAGDYAANDRKNRFGVIATKEGTNDFRYPFCLCNGFGFKSSAGGFLEWNAKALGYRQDRGDYGSANWTFASGLAGSSNAIAHHDLTLSLAPVGGAFVNLGVTDIDIGVDIPLYSDQDSQTGLYIGEPVQQGKTTVNASITLSRHSVDTYLAYRDSFQEVFMKACWRRGSYKFDLYLPSMILSESSPTGDDVAKQPITFVTGPEPATGNPFATEIGSNVLIQKGPLFCITKNTNSVNEMRRA